MLWLASLFLCFPYCLAGSLLLDQDKEATSDSFRTQAGGGLSEDTDSVSYYFKVPALYYNVIVFALFAFFLSNAIQKTEPAFNLYLICLFILFYV